MKSEQWLGLLGGLNSIGMIMLLAAFFFEQTTWLWPGVIIFVLSLSAILILALKNRKP